MKLSFAVKSIITTAVALVGMALFFIGAALSADIMIFVGGGIIMLAIIFSFIFNRCPFCGMYLGSGYGFFIKYCPYCGEKLDD
ncbi:MAG: hypothetical protein IKT37_09800 [Clostridia bacterium]|nr:hypothetical protein [Clostridia bacterium]